MNFVSLYCFKCGYWKISNDIYDSYLWLTLHFHWALLPQEVLLTLNPKDQPMAKAESVRASFGVISTHYCGCRFITTYNLNIKCLKIT